MAIKTDTSMTIRMNLEVKRQAQKIFADLGMDMTTAINVFLRQAIAYQGFPFEIRITVPNSETLAAIREVEEMKKDPTKGKSYTDVDEMMKELLE